MILLSVFVRTKSRVDVVTNYIILANTYNPTPFTQKIQKRASFEFPYAWNKYAFEKLVRSYEEIIGSCRNEKMNSSVTKKERVNFQIAGNSQGTLNAVEKREMSM